MHATPDFAELERTRARFDRVTPAKVRDLANSLGETHQTRFRTYRRSVPVRALRPTKAHLFRTDQAARRFELAWGLAEPVLVVQGIVGLFLVDGHHRARAAQDLGLERLQAYVLEPDTPTALALERNAQDLGLESLGDLRAPRQPVAPASPPEAHVGPPTKNVKGPLRATPRA